MNLKPLEKRVRQTFCVSAIWPVCASYQNDEIPIGRKLRRKNFPSWRRPYELPRHRSLYLGVNAMDQG